MPSLPHSLISYLHVVAGVWRDDPREDAELLARFADSGDEAAFKALVYRHGPLVWRSCTYVLGDGPDAEDAFQAAFLALARRAGRLRREPLAGWLHRVANRAALKVDVEVRRRRNVEHHLWAVTPCKAATIDRAELYAALDEELMDLPERLRVPLVLRYLEGKTLEDVARIVGCCRRAIGKRLTRGEALLRKRLEQRGLELGILSAGVLLPSTVTASAVPARLIGSTARAAVAFRSGTLLGRAAEAAGAVLGTLPASLKTTLLRKSLWIILACVCSLGVGLAAWQASSAHSEAVESPEAAAAPQAGAEPSGGQGDCHGDPLPRGALARLGTLRLRHGGSALRPIRQEANSVVFSWDGKALITAGPGNPIRLWNAATGKLLRSFGNKDPNDPVWFVVLSPDGNTLAAVNWNRSVSLWEMATGKLLCQLRTGTLALVFSQDGRTFLTASSDNHLRVWETATGKGVRDQPLLNTEKAGRLSTAIFSPDGKTLASIHQHDVNRNNVVYLWEATSGKELYHLSLGSGRELYHLSLGEVAIPRGAIAFSPDSRLLAVSTDLESGDVHLWETATGKEVRKWTPEKTGTYSVAFSPDGKLLATGSRFGPVRLWETATGKELRQCQGYRAHVRALAFSPDGSTLASLAGLHDYTARLWEVASGKERLRTSRGHVGPVLSVTFSADAKSVISGGRDGLVGFWDAETGQEQRPPLRGGDFQALAALASDGKTFVTVSNCFSLKMLSMRPEDVVLKAPSLVGVWDRATGRKLREFKGFVGAAQSLALSPDGKVLLWNSLTRVYLLDVAAGKTIREFPDTDKRFKCAVLSPDGKTLAMYFNEHDGWAKGTIHFYETATGKDLGSIQAHKTQPWCLALSPDGQTCALAGIEKNGDYPIRLWRVERGKKDWKETGKLVGHRDELWALTFSPDGKTLASASNDGTLRLWEVATGQERRRFAGHSGNVWCLAFAPDGRRLAAGGDDTTILVWDVTGRLRRGQLRSANLSPLEVRNLWADLAGADASRAGQAIWTLAAAPAQVLPFLREHLRPAAPVGLRIARLLADLDSDDFAVRQRATNELAKLGEAAEPALRQALAKSDSLERRRRLEQLLEQLPTEKFPLSGEELLSHRAMEVLGQMSTPEALALLEELARSEPATRQTLEAQAIVKRLRARVKATQP